MIHVFENFTTFPLWYVLPVFWAISHLQFCGFWFSTLQLYQSLAPRHSYYDHQQSSTAKTIISGEKSSRDHENKVLHAVVIIVGV